MTIRIFLQWNLYLYQLPSLGSNKRSAEQTSVCAWTTSIQSYNKTLFGLLKDEKLPARATICVQVRVFVLFFTSAKCQLFEIRQLRQEGQNLN